MYQENNNSGESSRSRYEYHYSYRPDYSEPVPTWSEPEPPKKKSRRGLKIVAGVLCAALLLGGSFGIGYYFSNRGGADSGADASNPPQTQMYVSDREAPEVNMVAVTGKDKLTYPQIYAANVNSCVSINVSATAGYNYFGQPVQTASSGSGFIITEDGYIVTNYHVISGGTTVEVTLNDGTTYPAQIIGGEEDYDIAVIKVDPGESKLQPVVIGESANLLVGEDVIAIGNPLGELTFSMSEGIVSCLNREINVDGTPFNMIQITSAVNSGNSGGPLFNVYGEVVGIVSAKYSTSSSGTTVEGLGFAIPMDDVRDMIVDIMENGRVTTRPYMGIYVADASRYPQTGVAYGGYLTEVVEGGPADLAGLQVGDVITMIGTTTITSRSDVTSAVGSKTYSAGDTTTVTYVRDGKIYTTELTFGSTMDMPESTQQQTQPSNGQTNPYDDSYSGGYYPYDGSMDSFFDQFFGGYGFGYGG